MTVQWLAELQSGPTRAVSRALAGFVDFGDYQRADTDDAIVGVLKELEDADPYREPLARGIWDWLKERREFSPAQRQAYGLDPFIREIREALIIAQRLNLNSVTKNILADFWRWENWSQKLQLRHSSRDVRLQLLKLCALHQQALDDSALEPRWIQLCRQAGTAIPMAYLDVALLGLRTLPRKPGDDLAPRVAFALGLWAAIYRPAREEFVERWLSVQQLMPRADPVWRRIIDEAIYGICRQTSLQDPASPPPSADGGRVQIFQAAVWWRASIKTKGQTGRSRPQERSRAAPHRDTLFLSPMPEEARDLISLARDGFTDRIADLTRDLFERHEQWARHHGNCYHYHRALTLISPAFLGLASRRATELLMHYVRRGLMWDEQYPTLWNVWQRCLSKLGQNDQAENVAWEAVRRFPGNAQVRTWLAQLLVDANRGREAEHLLREVGNLGLREPAYTMVLAKLVAADKTRLHEALAIATAGLEINPENSRLLVFAAALYLSLRDSAMASKLLDRADAFERSSHYYSIRFRLAYRESGLEEARRWLDLGLKEHPGSPDLLKKLKMIDDDAAELEDDVLSDVDVDVSTPRSADLDAAGDIAEHDITERDITDDSAAEVGGATQFAADQAADLGSKETAREPAKDIGVPASSPVQPPSELVHGSSAATPPPKATTAKPATAQQADSVRSKRPQPKPEPEPDYAFIEVLRHGRAKRADFALNGAGLTGAARKSEQVALEKLVKSDPEFLFGQIVLGRRVTKSREFDIEGISIPPAVQVEVTLRSGQLDVLRRMAGTGVEVLLTDLACALAGDDEALDRWQRGIPKLSGHEGYASRILQRLFADVSTTDMSALDRAKFRTIWIEPVSDVSRLSSYFFQAIDASLLFSVANKPARAGH